MMTENHSVSTRNKYIPLVYERVNSRHHQDNTFPVAAGQWFDLLAFFVIVIVGSSPLFFSLG